MENLSGLAYQVYLLHLYQVEQIQGSGGFPHARKNTWHKENAWQACLSTDIKLYLANRNDLKHLLMGIAQNEVEPTLINTYQEFCLTMSYKHGLTSMIMNCTKTAVFLCDSL